jgi:dienelactone hydrolase
MTQCSLALAVLRNISRMTMAGVLALNATNGAMAAPVSQLAGTESGKIEFNSYTPKEMFNLVRRTYDKTPTVIYGILSMPVNPTGKVPAVIIAHGSAGIESSEYAMAKDANEWGYATFIVDSFGPRGLTNVMQTQGALSQAADDADQLAALKLLATDSRIDATKIALVGFSRGGAAAFEDYFDMYRHGVIDGDLKFAANVAFYPGDCAIRYRADRGNTNRNPMLMLIGSKDEYVGVEACTNYVDTINKESGTNIQYKVYPGAYHSFDGLFKWHIAVNTEHGAHCTQEVFLTDKPGGGLGEARNYKTGEVINDYKQWYASIRGCVTHEAIAVGPVNDNARNESIKDVQAFLSAAFAK